MDDMANQITPCDASPIFDELLGHRGILGRSKLIEYSSVLYKPATH